MAGCGSHDLLREAARRGIRLDRVRVDVDGDFAGDPAVSTEITYRVAEIPNSLRRGTGVRLLREG